MKSNRRLMTLFLILCLAAMPACTSLQKQHPTRSTSPPPVKSYVYPGAEWEYIADPEQAGFSREKIAEVKEYLKTLPTTGLVVVSDGKILFDYGNITELSYLASVRKSVLSMLYGNYVAEGKIRLDKTLAELGINDHGKLTDAELEATIDDLLQARSGIYHPASNPGDNLAEAPPRGSKKRGEYFLYSNWDFNALGTIFEQETGRNIYDALETDLAVPIGMQDFKRDAQRKSGDLTRSIHPAYHMWLSTRDMARIGYLMLRQGNWAGRQIVPREWVKKTTSAATPLNEMNPEYLRQGRLGYGYLWWVFDGPEAKGVYEDAYTGRGAGGQFITVFPRLDLVVAHKTNMQANGGKQVNWDMYLKLLDKILSCRKNQLQK